MREAKLIVVSGQTTKSEVPLTDLPLLIGRNRTAGLPIAHTLVSRNHCEIYELGGALVVRDLGSANGTQINEQPIEEAVLRPGDRLTVGPLTFVAVYNYKGEVPDLDELQLATEDLDELFLDEVDSATHKPKSEKQSRGNKADRSAPRKEKRKPVVEKPAPARPKRQLDLAAKPPPLFEDEAAVATGERAPAAAATKRDQPAGKTPAAGKKSAANEVADLDADDLLSTIGDSGIHLEDSVLREESTLGADDPGTTPTLQSDDILTELEESEDFLILEDSQIGRLGDSGVGPPLNAADNDSGLEIEIVEESTEESSFDAVKLLHSEDSSVLEVQAVVELDDEDDIEVARPVRSRRRPPVPPPPPPIDKPKPGWLHPHGKNWEKSGIAPGDLGGRDQAVDFHLRLQLDDAGKLNVGTPVRVAGIDVGMVTDLNWVAVGGQLKAEALLNVQHRLADVLREDCRITLQDMNGSPVILIQSPGASETRLKHGQAVTPDGTDDAVNPGTSGTGESASKSDIPDADK